MTLTLHHLENSRSQRVLWLLEEMELSYELKRYPRHPETSLAPDALRQLHPLGKSPLLEEDGQVLAESGAIVEHLLDRPEGSRFRPAVGSPEHARHRFWMHYAEGSLMPLLLLRLVFNRVANAKMPFFVKPIAKGIVDKVEGSFVRPQLELHLGYIEKELEGRSWLCGEGPTGADIQMSFPLEAAASRVDLAAYPNVRAYVARIQARAAYQRGLERGGPYAYA